MTKTKAFAIALMLSSIWPSWYLLWNVPRQHVGDLPTYWTVVLLGFIQAVVVIFSAFLAIDALPDGKAKEEKRYKCAFALLGVLLFLSTCTIGYLNDKSQSETKQQLGLATTTLAEIKNCQRDPKCSQATILALADSALKKLPAPSTPKTPLRISTQATPIKEAPRAPFSSLSNNELRDKVKEFARHLHIVSNQISNAEDDYHKFLGYQLAPPPKGFPVVPNLAQQVAAKKKILDDLINSVVLTDAPLAMVYRQELLDRLGSEAKPTEFPPILPTEASVNQFLPRAFSWLDTWADQLSALNQD